MYTPTPTGNFREELRDYALLRSVQLIFLVQKKVFAGDRQLVYVTIPSPAEDDCSHVYCEAFALVSTGDNIGSCIGFVDRTGGHHNLGVLCLSAERSVQNRSKAEPLIRKAAELGCPTAIENLTIMSAGGTALKKADFPSILKCAPDNKISNTTKGIEKNINQCEEERNPSGFSSEDESALMAELTRTIDSCSSAPVTNDLEDRARWLMGRVEYFRRRGVPERKLYILEFRILQYMPDFVVRNFSQFYTFLREGISSIYVAVAFHLDKGNFAAAKKIADPLVQLLEKNKATLIDGHHCHQNSFELAMCTLGTRKVLETPSTKDNYTAFLVAYTRILQNTKDASGKRFLVCESRRYLRWAQSMSPQNASVWLYLGASYNKDAQIQLDCYQKALRYCYLKDDPYGLTAIYKHLAILYWFQNRSDITAALRELVVQLGDDAPELTFLLKKHPSSDRTPFRKVLQKQGIQIGFSDFAKETAELLSNREGKLRDHSEIQEIINTVQTLRL